MAAASTFGPARSSASRAWPGTARNELVEALTGLRKREEREVSLAGHDVTNHSSRDLSERGVAYVPGDRQRLWPRAVLPDRRQPGPDRVPRGAVSRLGVMNESGIARQASELDPASSTSGRHRPPSRRQRCRAATSRRSSWPASSAARSCSSSPTSPRAASTWARSSSSTSRSSPSATPARRCCSCRPSSTRSSSCPTASGSCTAAGSSPRFTARRAEKEQVGLMMATGHAGQATEERP